MPNLHYGFGTELYKYFVFDDPAWDYTSYDFSTWAQDVAETAELLDATDTDLGRFRDEGGKIIFWTGWSDPALTALGTIDYYERIEAGESAGEAALRDYARLFMLPGVLHCGGGRGPDSVDWLTAIEDWVEHVTPPGRLLAAKLGETGEPVLTRPVCPVPRNCGLRRHGAARRRRQLPLHETLIAGALLAHVRELSAVRTSV